MGQGEAIQPLLCLIYPDSNKILAPDPGKLGFGQAGGLEWGAGHLPASLGLPFTGTIQLSVDSAKAFLLFVTPLTPV
jgi:hypothetical protein